MINSNKRHGFTLIELAVVLAIIAVVMAGVMDLTKINIERQKREETIERMEFIMTAIDNFVRENGYLPCPADPTRPFSDTEFGFEDDNSGDADCDDAINLEETTADNIYTGTVPVNTLNINPKYVMDGWNRRITYVVDEDLVTTANYTANNGGITVTTAGNGDIEPWPLHPLGTAGAFLLLSHGANGYGAWQGRGSASRWNPTGGESHEDNNVTASTGNGTFNMPLLQPTTDDIVMYKPKWRIAQ